MISSVLDVSAVAAGGAIGALIRWSLTLVAASIPGGSPPVGTTVANIVGCGLMGWFVVLAGMDWSETWAIHQTTRGQLAIRVGILGALTTFSTLVAESTTMWQEGHSIGLVLYLAANIILGVLAYSVIHSWARTHAI